MEDIRVAIIRHGFMGHEHEKKLSDFPGIKLVGLSGKDFAQLDEWNNKFETLRNE